MKTIAFERMLMSGLLPLGLASCAAPGAGTTAADVIPAVAPPAHAVKALQALAPPSELETRYGIQIAQLALTASGGLVDVRFKVLDAAKARALLADPANAPTLIAGDKPPLAPPHHALQGAKFSTGQIFYVLYPNLRGAVQRGGEVTVAMGDARLGPVRVP
jgi:hypothetical protein